MSSTFPIRPGMLAHASGALFLEPSCTLIIADLHLGYGWAQRRKGELGPLADSQSVEKIKQVCTELQPRRIVFLGDLVHAPRPHEAERAYIEGVLNGLCAEVELISVQGNHDRAFAREFAHLNVKVVPDWRDGGIVAIHGDKLPGQHVDDGLLLVGHLHPAMPVKDVSGAGRRMPVFLAGDKGVILPAFSPFAHGYNLLEGIPADFARLIGEPVLGFVASGRRVVAIGPFESAVRRMFEADTSAPVTFRKWRP